MNASVNTIISTRRRHSNPNLSALGGGEDSSTTSGSPDGGRSRTEKRRRGSRRRSLHRSNSMTSTCSRDDRTCSERRGRTCSDNEAFPKEEAAKNSTITPAGDEEPTMITWREIITLSLLMCAFLACMSVFFLLGNDTDDNGQAASFSWASSNNSYCEPKSFLQSNCLDADGGANANGTCSYSIVKVCTDNPMAITVALENLETIMYMLLLGSLLTVVCVSVSLFDDNEDSMLPLVISGKGSNIPHLGSMDATSDDELSDESRGGVVADLFPDTSVLFADIVGFEAWSSQREPKQCLTLLEAIYDEFDRLAKAQGIFKVEAVADSYIACTGLPEAREDHAEALLRFADDCRKIFKETTEALEATLGPDTSDLELRCGIHSGPVTALRGGRSRFQLFGDTVKTTDRMMQTSKAGKIQLSHETMQLLPPMLQEDWVKVRDQPLISKGSDDSSSTYWLAIPSGDADSSLRMSTHRMEEAKQQEEEDRIPRLVDWNVQMLTQVLNQIVAKRHAEHIHYQRSSSSNAAGVSSSTTPSPILAPAEEQALDQSLRKGKFVIDEVAEVIDLPRYDAAVTKAHEELKQEIDVEVSDEVVDELREYITIIAKSYKSNPFHNFEHACHVTMSVSKLLSRILRCEKNVNFSGREDQYLAIHDHTYGITSDPLTQFACMFSALIHDAEHDGVPNAQLVKEETELAAKYKGQSVAEQNSVDVAWELLMRPQFKELRSTIYSNKTEMVHFRKLVVNCVMATDICDKQLKELRNKRWDRAFAMKTTAKHSTAFPHLKDTSNGSNDDTSEIAAGLDPATLEEDVNRKATIVIEHLLQASDVSHTMQHFHVFRQWNEKLFMEMYFAFKDGRSAVDPSKFWYKGEIGFFDFYVIPLAKKLKECGVFGVSSDEYLNYALKNRQEWLGKGNAIVDVLIEKAEQAYARTREIKRGPSVKLAPCA